MYTTLSCCWYPILVVLLNQCVMKILENIKWQRHGHKPPKNDNFTDIRIHSLGNPCCHVRSSLFFTEKPISKTDFVVNGRTRGIHVPLFISTVIHRSWCEPLFISLIRIVQRIVNIWTLKMPETLDHFNLSMEAKKFSFFYLNRYTAHGWVNTDFHCPVDLNGIYIIKIAPNEAHTNNIKKIGLQFTKVN